MSSSATAIESRLDLLRRQLAAAQEQHAETQRAVRAAERKEERAGSVVYSLREQLEMELLRSWGNQPDLKALLKKGGGGIFYEALSALAEVKGLHLWGEWCDTKEKVLRFGMNRGEIGAVARIWIGRAIINAAETLVTRMPFVGAIYGGLKQIAETILSQDDDKFDRACLIEYPRKGLWGLGFVAGPAKGEIATEAGRRGQGTFLAVFVPNSPNATAGFLMFVPEHEVHILDMPVEDAVKLVISGGLVYPAPTGGKNIDDKSVESR